MDRFGERQKYFYTLIGRLCASGVLVRLYGDEIMLAG
jgi:hypothetical protein